MGLRRAGGYFEEHPNYLTALRPSVSDEVAPLVDNYVQALSLYVKDRDKSGLFRKQYESLRVIGLDKAASFQRFTG